MTCFRKFYRCIPQRWIVAAMGFFAFFNAYTLRICLSMAITKMAVALNTTAQPVDETCPPFDEHVSQNVTSARSGGTFEWTEYTQGIILSAFYWGYLLTHIPGGLLAEKFGPKYTMGLGVFFTAAFTVITPTATVWGDSTALIILRFLMGLGEGVIQPSMSCLLAHWIPPQERSLITSIVYTGIKAGILVSSITSGLIMDKSSDDWPTIFHLFGGIGILWFIFWVILCYNNPSEHPFITDQEKEYLHEHIGSYNYGNRSPFPWKHALSSKPFLALVLLQSGQDWCHYTIMSDLPKYMSNVLRLPVHLNGYASSMFHISSSLFCMIMSWLSDWLISKERMSITNIRKMNSAISSLGPAILLISAMYAGCNVVQAISLITLGLTLAGAAVPGMKVNVLDLSPNYAGTLMGISNGIGAFTGVLAPYTVGVLAPNQTLSEWRLIFWIVAGVYCVTTLNFVIFASGEVQPWNNLTNSNKQKKSKSPEQNIDLLGKKIKT